MIAMVACCACATNPGMPRYRTSRPAALVPVGPPRPAASVAVKMKTLAWWTLTGADSFVLRFDEEADSGPVRGKPMGAVRSRNIDLDNPIFEAVRCAWGGDAGHQCRDLSLHHAGEIAHDAITEARAELRAHAADAGASAVADVRCFAERKRPRDGKPGPSVLWCEGFAVAGAADDSSAPREQDPALPGDREPELPRARFTLLADGSVGMLGDQPIVASTLGLRYRPIELGFYIVDMQRETIAPNDNGLVGLGLSLLGRKAVREHSRADAIIGGTASAAFQNGATNPDIDGMYQAFVGLAYQSPWRIMHVEPWVQLRAGAAYGAALKNQLLPLVELHIGLATPERR